MACLNRPFAKQQGATCWFNAIMNGFVLSRKGRIIMYKAIARYIDQNVQTRRELEDFMRDDITCIRPGQLHSKFNFYKWFYRWLVLGLPMDRNTRIVMRNLVKNKRSDEIDQHNLPSKALVDILNRMDITSYSLIDIHTGHIYKNEPNCEFVIYAATTIDTNNPLGRFGSELALTVADNYRLDHASLGVFFEQGGSHSSHAITGVTCITTGEPILVDSNSDHIYACDWRIPANIMASQGYVNFCSGAYHSPPSRPIILFAIYTRNDITNRNLPNIFSLLNRHKNAMNTE